MKNRHLLWLLIIFITSSCVVVETTQLEVMKPAELTIPPYINSIGLLNHNVLIQDEPFKTEIQQALFQLDSVNSEMLVYKVYEELLKSPRFNKVEIAEEILMKNKEHITKPVSWDVIQALCDSLSVDGILALEAIVIKDKIKSYSYNDGYSTSNYKLIMFSVNSLWRLYMTGNTNTVHKQVFSDTIYMDEIESYEHLELLLKRKQGIGWIANKISDEQYTSVSDKFAPYWVAETRVYLKGTNTEFRLAAKYAEADQWIKAAEIWQKQSESKPKYMAAAACFNMALVCEVQGELPLAKTWIEKSIQLKSTDLSLSYHKIIKDRLIENNKLNNQFGIIEK